MQAVVNFEISLRAASKDTAMKQKEKKWNNLPKKERKEFPISYPGFKQEKEELKKARTGEVKNVTFGSAL
jgi:hypothetical protein